MPVNGYLTQGAFGTSANDIGNLLDTQWTYANADQNGQPYGYSLDTHTRLNMLIDSGVNHVKRVEVIRPGGNAVVFNFPWIGTVNNVPINEFSPYGTPMGWSNRDAGRTYVLRDLTHDSDIAGTCGYLDQYALEFENRITQTFAASSGSLQSVSDANGLSVSPASGLPSALPTSNSQDTTDSGRYNFSFNWSGGRVASISYQTKDAAQTIQDAITYGSTNPDITALTKSDGGTTITPFSYSLSGATITNNGNSLARGGSVASGSVTLTMTPSASGSLTSGTVSDQYTLNSNDLITKDIYTLAEGSGNPTTTATTQYVYSADAGTYNNGAPKFGKLVEVIFPDQSWVGYRYDPNTGWMVEKITPFMNSTFNAGSSPSGNVPNPNTDLANNRVASFDYNAADSGNGAAADVNLIYERPRQEIDTINGTQTGESFADYGASWDVGGTLHHGAGDYVSRVATAQSGGGATWAYAGLFSDVQITNFDSENVISATGNLSVSKSSDSNKNISYTSTGSWLGNNDSQDQQTVDAFGGSTFASSAAIGSAYASDSGTADSFGRIKADALAGGISDAATYGSNDWLGPSQVTERDGSTTNYTYTSLGQVATKTIYVGQQNSVTYSFTYDAAGNVLSENEAGAGGLSLKNNYTWDALGRQTSETDNAGGSDITASRLTTHVFSDSASGTSETTTNPDGSTQVDVSYLDGTLASEAGQSQSTAAVTPSSASEGVIATGGTDANGNPDSNVTPGSTWQKVTSGGSSNTTITYTNVMGQVYLVQQSGPTISPDNSTSSGAYADQVTAFDGNDRPVLTGDFDGTKNHAVYNPQTGVIGATWLELNQNNNNTPVGGTDRKTVYLPTALTTGASTQAGVDTQVYSDGGVQDDNSLVWNGGMNSSETIDGMTSTDTISNVTGGGFTETVTAPDSTRTVDSYSQGLLGQEQQIGADGSTVIATSSATYDGLRRPNTNVDYAGTTNIGYFQDGTEKSIQLPGHNAATVSTLNQQTEDPNAATRADNGTVNTPENALGLVQSQSGAGVLPASFGFDGGGTGSLNSLTTYQSNTLNGTGAATTGWTYDQGTGELQSKTYADGSQDTYLYNVKQQLTGLSMPGISAASFGYDVAGELSSSYLIDGTTGTVSYYPTYDDLGRVVLDNSTDNGRSFATSRTFTSIGDLNSEIFSSAGNASVSHGYAATSSSTPDALQTTTLNLPNGQAAVSQGYGYEATGKRLQTITVNGVTFTIAYLPNSDQINSITAGNIVTTLNPDSMDPARLGGLTVVNNSNNQTLYSGTYTYNQLDQRTQDVISRQNIGNDGSFSTENATFNYKYDPTQGDALTSVKDGNGNVLYSYSYDGVGNHTGTSFGTLNSINEYSNLTYNGRGDLTSDANYNYGYDAQDRLISVAPKTPTSTSLKLMFGYDGQGRRDWKDVYGWNGSAWVLSYSRHYLWDGSQLIAELDGSNKIVVEYTWGPTGLLGITDYTNPGGPRTYITIADASGNIVSLVDALSRLVSASYHYDPYGNLLSATGPAASLCNFRAKGYYSDPETPWIAFAGPATDYGTTRVVYLPGGFWMQRDPSGVAGGVNVTGYLGGDPINGSDSSGLQPESPADELKRLNARFRASGSVNWSPPTNYPYLKGLSAPPDQLSLADNRRQYAFWRDQMVAADQQLAALDQLLPLLSPDEASSAQWTGIVRQSVANAIIARSLADSYIAGAAAADIGGDANYLGEIQKNVDLARMAPGGAAAANYSEGSYGVGTAWAAFDVLLFLAPWAKGGAAARGGAALAEEAGSSAIRARVLANIAESRAARASSNIDVLFAKEAGLGSPAAAAPVSGSQWFEYFRGRYGAESVSWSRVPDFTGGRTTGVLATSAGDVDLMSGWSGRGAAMPRGSAGFNIITRSHVEGHAAAAMEDLGVNEATLYLNRIPCGGIRGCDVLLPRMLGEGRQLRVIVPTQFDRVYMGVAR